MLGIGSGVSIGGALANREPGGRGSILFSGTASAKVNSKASATGSIQFSGSASASVVGNSYASGSGSIQFSGTAAATVAAKAAGTGSIEFSGTGAASVSGASGLPSGTLLWAHAADASSYSGSGNLITNMAGDTDYDLWLGSTSGSDSQDPSFVGTAGTAGAYFETDGGDVLTISNNTQVLSDLHRTDQGDDEWWVAATFRMTTVTRRFNLLSTIGTASGTGSNGVYCECLGDYTFIGFRSGGGGKLFWNPTFTPQVNTDYFMCYAVNKSTNTIRFWVNSDSVQTGTPTISASTTAAEFPANSLSRDGRAADPGTRWKGLMFGTGNITDTDVSDIIKPAFEALDGVTY